MAAIRIANEAAAAAEAACSGGGMWIVLFTRIVTCSGVDMSRFNYLCI